MDKVRIELKDLKIRAFHGIYREEQEIGSFFIVHVLVDFLAHQSQDFTLQNTLNYEDLHKIVVKEMSIATPLLETVCSEILKNIENTFNGVRKSNVSIEKLNPPIAHFNGKSVKVSLERNYEEQ